MMVINHLKAEYPEQWGKAEKTVLALLAKIAKEVDGERALQGVKKQWPALELARWEWEFLRRSKLFQAECDRIPVDPQGIRQQTKAMLPNLCYVFALTPAPLFAADLLFTQYKLDFQELLTALATLFLISPERIARDLPSSLQDWASDFIKGKKYKAPLAPGNVVKITHFPPHGTFSKGDSCTMCFFEIEFPYGFFGDVVGKLCAVLPVFEYGTRVEPPKKHPSGVTCKNGSRSFTYDKPKEPVKYARIAYTGGLPDENTDARDATYLKIISVIVDVCGQIVPPGSPQAEMRATLDRQIRALDILLGWVTPLKGEKDKFFYRSRKSALEKINRIEQSAKHRMTLFPAN